jgi:hypothetical protein
MVDSRHRRSREAKVEKIACFAANNDVSTASDLSTAVYCSKSASIFSKPAKIQENCAISKLRLYCNFYLCESAQSLREIYWFIKQPYKINLFLRK